MASFPAARTSFHCQATGAAAMTTHNAAVCIFVKLANRESNAAKPSSVGGVNCAAACVTAAATAVGADDTACSNDAAATAPVTVLNPPRWKNRPTFSDPKSTRLKSSHSQISYAALSL